MNAARKLQPSVVLWQIWFSICLSGLLSWCVPILSLLNESLRPGARRALFLSILAGGIVAAGRSWFVLRRHRQLLAALSAKSSKIEVEQLREFGKLPGQQTRAWLVPHCLALSVLLTPLRPSLMDTGSGLTLMLLSCLSIAAASLPLNVVIRKAVLRTVELAPRHVMRDVLASSERTADARGRINRRLVAAVAAPMFLVAVGSALIVNAHIRRADERARANTAQLLAGSILEQLPGPTPGAGLSQALERAESFGFSATVLPGQMPQAIEQLEDGQVRLTLPLSKGSAVVHFQGTTTPVLGFESLLLATLAVICAALLGFLLGNRFTHDLYTATQRVRTLGTDAVLSGLTVIQKPASFGVVRALGRAIEQLAERFRVFAKAQEASIGARAAATKMRGLFFASVSHDLKSPLNAILGFTELVRAGPLTPEQEESLNVIQTRGRELLALIETILDAARVEEGQLSLVAEEVSFDELYASALEKAGQLAGDYPIQIWDEIEANIPELVIDRARVARAIATFVAYSIRSTQSGKMRLRAERETETLLRVDVDVPGRLHSPQELEAMMAPASSGPGKREHRGLALGLRLARSVIELHRGRVRVIDRGRKGAMFCIFLPTVSASREGKPLLPPETRPHMETVRVSHPDGRALTPQIGITRIIKPKPQ